MNLESKNAVVVGKKEMVESLCYICAYKGCTNCPSLVPIRGRKELVKDFPQIKEGTELKNGKIIVHSCDYFSRMNKEKIKVKRAEFVWDPRQKKHVKVIK